MRTYEAWLERSNFTNGQTSIVSRPWFNGFIHFICDDDPTIAAYLLQDAGKIDYGSNNNNNNNNNNDNDNNSNNIDKWKWQYKPNSKPGEEMVRPIARGLPGRKEQEQQEQQRRKRNE